MRRLIVVFAVALIVVGSFAVLYSVNDKTSDTAEEEMETYVGVTYGGDSVEEAKMLVDKVKNYTNLFVLQSGLLQRNYESVEEIGDYAVAKGLSFLPYFGHYMLPSFTVWLDKVTQKWGDKFLGVYYKDEPAGKMLDYYVEFNDSQTGGAIMKTQYGDVAVEKPNGIVIHYELGGIVHVAEPANVTDDEYGNYGIENTGSEDLYATFYPNGTTTIAHSGAPAVPKLEVSTQYYELLMNLHPLNDPDEIADKFYANNQDAAFLANETKVFTSDYAVYWFDYMAGYDVLLSQVGWNNSFAQNIALTRGAAAAQGKVWGIIVTWKYDAPPYLDSGSEVLAQMVDAYRCGAKYLVLFNYYTADSGPYGTLKEEHFAALEQFWETLTHDAPVPITSQTVLLLPSNYAYGMRWREDRLWGVLPADEKAFTIWNTLQAALSGNGLQLDVVYEDAKFPLNGKYANVILWNQTISG